MTAPPEQPKPTPKAPKPLFTPHENKRDKLLCSPAFGALFLTSELCVVGGGGGGKKYELPNTLLLMKVTPQRPQHQSETTFGEVVSSLDFEEAGTIQTISDSFVVSSSSSMNSSATSGGAHYFVLSHINAFSLIKWSQHNNSLSTVCRVALNTAALNADTKPVCIVNLSKDVGGPLIFAGQDDQTVAVFRLSTLIQWSERETAVKSTEVLPVAQTVDDVKRLALAVCDFPTGGRVCDLRIKVIPTSLPETGKDVCIAVAICTRDKSLLVGHFDQDDRKFVPSKKFTSEDFGFTKKFMLSKKVKNGKNLPFPPVFMGKSIRTCQFSPFPAHKIFAQDDAGKFVGVSTDLFVAIQPLKLPVCAVRISLTSKKSSIETLSAKLEELVCSECSEAPATSILLPVEALGDPQTRDNAFCVATVEGSLIEFIFSSADESFVRRIVSGFHFDAVTSIALAPNAPRGDATSNNNNSNNNKRVIVSTDIARRIAFHLFDPKSRTTSTATVESMEKVKQPPSLFTNELTSAALSKRRKKTFLRFVLLSILILIIAVAVNFGMTYF